MIATRSDTLLAALDRRLQVDRVVALEPLSPPSADEGRAPTSGRAAPTLPLPASAGTAPAGPTRAAPIDGLPVGRVVVARILDVPEARQVLAGIGDLRISLAWAGGNGAVPRPGSEIALRVLAHSPALLFENVGESPVMLVGAGDGDAQTHLSPGALQLQSSAATNGPLRPVPFSAPILKLEAAAADDASSGRPPPAPHATSATPSGSSALDDVLVGVVGSGIERALPEAAAASGSTGNAIDATASAALPLPLVLQGPAWHGQPLELVVRRDRADDAFDNAALDQWHGDLLIDLPHLGRVAGHLAWSMHGLRIRLEGRDDDSVAAMNRAAAELAAGLAQVDLPVLSLAVGQWLSDTTLGRGSSQASMP